ncbi:MAG: DUF2202 domain-containing protein [Halothiobacillaceae bacterium]|nr:MAG: DUF2202 domain-containing protein [Halothiobacillaceae bacterium]
MNMNKTLLALAIAGLSLTAGLAPVQAGHRTAPVLTAEETAEVLYMREEEKAARDVYLTLAEHWYPTEGNSAVVTALNNIAAAEQTHMERIEAILEKYNLPDPVDAAETRGAFVNPDLALLYTTLVAQGKLTVQDTLRVGGLIEETDIRDLKHSIEITQARDIVNVYANLLCGSRNHLRAFAGQITQTQGGYIAQVLPQTEVDAIVNSPRERCGR